jgi:hypothetical protein
MAHLNIHARDIFPLKYCCVIQKFKTTLKAVSFMVEPYGIMIVMVSRTVQ